MCPWQHLGRNPLGGTEASRAGHQAEAADGQIWWCTRVSSRWYIGQVIQQLTAVIRAASQMLGPSTDSYLTNVAAFTRLLNGEVLRVPPESHTE